MINFKICNKWKERASWSINVYANNCRRPSCHVLSPSVLPPATRCCSLSVRKGNTCHLKLFHLMKGIHPTQRRKVACVLNEIFKTSTSQNISKMIIFVPCESQVIKFEELFSGYDIKSNRDFVDIVFRRNFLN